MQFKIILSVFGFLLLSLFANASETYQATTQLNIRSGAGTAYEVVGSISQGDKVLIDTIITGWGQVIVDGQVKGFASMKYLTTDFKDYSNNSKSDSKEKSPWTSVLTILFLIGLAVYQLFFKGGKSSGGSLSKSFASKPKPNKWYFCKHCAEKVQSPKKPSSMGCSREKFHHWYELAEVGEKNYSCKNCGTTIWANKKPSSMGCSRDNFHHWYEL